MRVHARPCPRRGLGSSARRGAYGWRPGADRPARFLRLLWTSWDVPLRRRRVRTRRRSPHGRPTARSRSPARSSVSRASR